MPKVRSALVDSIAGLLILAIAFLATQVLLQSTRLIHLFFPLVVAVAFAAGVWRGAVSRSAMVVIVVLANLPLVIVAAMFFTGRNLPFMVLPALTLVLVIAGCLVGRRRGFGWLATASLAIALVAAAFAGPAFIRFALPSHEVRENAVPFTIHRIDGTTVTSASLRGSVVVLDFWATWCTPCQRELPMVQRTYEQMKGHPDVVFVAIDGVMSDTPEEADTAQSATAYFQRAGLTIPLAWDGGAVLEKSLAVQGFPTLLVLDRQGRVRYRHVGFVGAVELERMLTAEIEHLRSEPAG